ncbi:hypothetical protein P7H60_00205 [Vagococcus carniphilus]|uniref:hypothetical protein n=1 Tax=Vagococcus carniphilus TaxID=218144 RepID=UPI00288E108B|nr:hypothetical protein [Vagococcus carniphilus]MDT2829666.1 hypothetical protein [Vagococcus carniphilus]MDT2839125.1 hypothetical protein [Vagococcus carniphilus]MDT2847585.1 hypothetical protein [Vagococcus carniphilus]MDT2853183.1 hypothetical protein [Vagococcus carniphilus]
MEVFLIYSANQSFLSKAIKCYTKETYNHVSIAFDKELTQTYSFGRKKVTNPLIGGFVQEDFWDPFFLTSQCAIYSLEVTNEQYQAMTAVINYFDSNKQLFQYNFLGLLALSLKLNIEREHAFFCSEFIATLLAESNIADFSKKHHFVTPKDILELQIFEKVYEGQVINYLVPKEEGNLIKVMTT